MGVLDQIMQMKGQGIPDAEIVNQLAQQGISPKEINNALKQAQIKNAVSDYDEGEMQPSIMQEGEVPSPQQTQTQEYYAPQEEYSPQPEQQQYVQQETGYAPQGMDTDTIMEIAEQVFSEKMKKTQKQVDAVSEAAINLQTKILDFSERLKKIETIIDQLQLSVLEKVGSYGQNLESVRKEMSMMQDSFSKMVSAPREKETVKQISESPAKNISKKK